MSERIRIRLLGLHLAYIDKGLVRKFESTCKVINLNSWIREQAYNDFKIKFYSEDSLDDFKNILEKNYYDGIGDWLREKMRLAILEKERLGD